MDHEYGVTKYSYNIRRPIPTVSDMLPQLLHTRITSGHFPALATNKRCDATTNESVGIFANSSVVICTDCKS